VDIIVNSSNNEPFGSSTKPFAEAGRWRYRESGKHFAVFQEHPNLDGFGG